MTQARSATHIADSQDGPKTPPVSLGKTASAKAKPGVSEKRLEWQQVNQVTWRLIGPDAPQVLVHASHGQWGGYQYPKALAYVFDVGANDWRIRVRRGRSWRAFGCMIDFATAKQIAQREVRTRPNRGQASSAFHLICSAGTDGPVRANSTVRLADMFGMSRLAR